MSRRVLTVTKWLYFFLTKFSLYAENREAKDGTGQIGSPIRENWLWGNFYSVVLLSKKEYGLWRNHRYLLRYIYADFVILAWAWVFLWCPVSFRCLRKPGANFCDGPLSFCDHKAILPCQATFTMFTHSWCSFKAQALTPLSRPWSVCLLLLP